MEKKENIREYLQKMLDRWNKYDELDGFVAENFRVDLENTLEYWDLRIANNNSLELDKAREEGLSESKKEAFTLEQYKQLYELVQSRWDLGYPIEEQKVLLKVIRDLCRV